MHFGGSGSVVVVVCLSAQFALSQCHGKPAAFKARLHGKLLSSAHKWINIGMNTLFLIYKSRHILPRIYLRLIMIN